MAYERFANGGLSSLEAGIDNSVTSLMVKSAVGFPTGGNFRIIVDNEIMLVTDVQGKTFTVMRAQEGTSAASHDADAAVFHVLTAGALAQRDIEQFATGAVAARDAAGQAGRLYLPTEGFVSQDNGVAWDMMPYWRMTPPASGDFSWINQGGATVADTKGVMVVSTPSVASGESIRCLVKTAPGTPYEITVAMLAQSPAYTTTNVSQFGICWRESGSGKLLTYGFGTQNYAQGLFYTQWANPTTPTNQFVYTAPWTWPIWIRFADDGTNRTVKISGDGVTFQPVQASQGRTVYLTADQVGVFANSWKNTYAARVVSFLHWRET